MRSYFEIIIQLCIALFAALNILHILEWSLAVQNHPFPGFGSWMLVSVSENLIYSIVFSSFCALLILPFYKHPIWDKTIITIFSSLCLVGAAMLSHYFINTQLTLGADFFGYSAEEIERTIKSSGEFSSLDALIYIIPFFTFLVFLRLTAPYNWLSLKRGLTLLTLAAILIALGSLYKPTPDSPSYTWSTNKTWVFVKSGFTYFTAGFNKASLKSSESLNTFYVDTKANTTLSEVLDSGDSPPNIIIIAVEGLGQTFLAGGKQSGFTPFLDSLAEQSLYFSNTLSNTGRTFGALPTLLGSLPYAKEGFMELGPDYPRHHSMVEILNKNNYLTRFFYGGASRFDKQNLFLWEQGIGMVYDEAQFPKSAKKLPANQGGFSWGYPDHEVYSLLANKTSVPRLKPTLDIILTLVTHEPFKLPHQRYHADFESIKAKLDGSNRLPDNFEKYANIFECFHYADQSLKEWFLTMKAKGALNNTLVVITGDHRIIPMPFDGPLDRMQVPLIIASDLIKKPIKSTALNFHSDLFPSLMGWMRNSFDAVVPDSLFALSSGLSLAGPNKKKLGLMVNKGDLSHFVNGDVLLYRGSLYKQNSPKKWSSISDNDLGQKMQYELSTFRLASDQIVKNNLITTKTPSDWTFSKNPLAFGFTNEEKKWIKNQELEEYDADSLFFFCRELAFNKQFKESRIGLKHLLNISPTYADARILLGRTYSWNGKYAQAEVQLLKAIELTPLYYDGYNAIIDLYRWWDKPEEAKKYLKLALEMFPDNEEIKAKIGKV